mgnify:CR=1 FL=1
MSLSSDVSRRFHKRSDRRTLAKEMNNARTKVAVRVTRKNHQRVGLYAFQKGAVGPAPDARSELRSPRRTRRMVRKERNMMAEVVVRMVRTERRMGAQDCECREVRDRKSVV